MAVLIEQNADRQGDAFPAGLAYTAFAAYRAVEAPSILPRRGRAALAAEAVRALLSPPDVAIRGSYDTSGYRADTQLLLWLAAPSSDLLQSALTDFGRTRLGTAFEPTWTAIGVHREPELPRADLPAFYRGEQPRRYVCVSATAYAPQWYRLSHHERRRMLLDAGRASREFDDVRASTVSAFGLGEHEWLTALESDDLVRIVDRVRILRTSESREYTSAESGWLCGLRRPLGEIVDALP